MFDITDKAIFFGRVQNDLERILNELEEARIESKRNIFSSYRKAYFIFKGPLWKKYKKFFAATAYTINKRSFENYIAAKNIIMQDALVKVPPIGDA